MNKFNVYWLVARNTWDEALTYRLNFTMWRLRVFLSFISTYFLWLTLLPKGTTIAQYNQETMLTYVLGGSFLYSVVMSTRVAGVVDDIVQGNLSNYLLKPIHYISYYFFKDIGDKAMNIIFSFIEISIIFVILHPPVFLQTNLFYIISFIVSVVLAIYINFSLNMILSFIGFFSSEAWAPRFIFYILLTFFAGSMFPLDIFPTPIYFFLKSLPFSYLLYFPLKVYLGQATSQDVFVSLSLALAWAIFLCVIVNMLWKKGLHLYAAEGR